MKAAIGVLILVLILAVTNPGIDQFVDWAVEELRSERDSVEILEVLEAAVARPIFRNTTERSSYGVASMFTVKGVGQEKRYLGIAGQFFALDGREIDIEALED